MDRRTFILAGTALACVGAAPPAAPFRPTRFSVEVRGSGADLILIPGLTAGREVWRATAEAMPDRRCHLLQVAGFAGEPARGNRQGPVIAPLAQEIARYIAANRLDRPAIVGHSMGGTLALMIGARHPALAARIMVVDMLPRPAGLFGAGAAFAGSLGNFMATPGGRRLAAAFVAAFSPPGTANALSDPDVVARVTGELMRLDLTADLARIRAPLTVVYASPDPRLAAAVDRDFAAAYATAPGARLVRIDGSGHMVMLDRPARFRAVLRDFLRT